MKTLNEITDLIESLNEDAHQEAYDSWIAADELMESEDEEDWQTAEEIREDASAEQASYFREAYWELDEEDQAAIKYWLDNDSDLKEQFCTYFGEDEFIDEFGSN